METASLNEIWGDLEPTEVDLAELEERGLFAVIDLIAVEVTEDEAELASNNLPVLVDRFVDQSLGWRALARCRGLPTGLFYPEKGGDTESPKKVCRACPVRVDCLEYAIVNHENFGIWGGMSDRERRPLCRQRSPR